jgi:hypothetical protein
MIDPVCIKIAFNQLLQTRTSDVLSQMLGRLERPTLSTIVIGVFRKTETLVKPMTEKPTPEQIAELRKLSKEARQNDWSEVVQSREEAAMRIDDLKTKKSIE